MFGFDVLDRQFEFSKRNDRSKQKIKTYEERTRTEDPEVTFYSSTKNLKRTTGTS